MRPPRPAALRLVSFAVENTRPPRLPLGVLRWDSDADAWAVVLDVSGMDVDDVAQIAAQIPRAADRPPATPVLILAQAVRRRHLLVWPSSWLRGTALVARVTRCTALVARGYVDVGACIDESGGDVTWGFSSPCSGRQPA